MRWVASELNLPYGTKIEIGLMKKPENRDVQKKSLVMKSMESVLRLEESLCCWERITTFCLELSEQLRCRQLLVDSCSLAVVKSRLDFHNRSRVHILLGATLRNNLGQVVHTYVPLSPSSITWYRPKGGDALAVAGKVTAGLAESNGSLPPGG